MPIGEASRLAPNAIFLPTRHSTYGPYAEQVKEIAERFCPVVQTASIDEFFLDWRGCDRLFTQPDDRDAVGPCISGIIDLRGSDRLEDGFVIEEGSIPSAIQPAMVSINRLAVSCTDAERCHTNRPRRSGCSRRPSARR